MHLQRGYCLSHPFFGIETLSVEVITDLYFSTIVLYIDENVCISKEPCEIWTLGKSSSRFNLHWNLIRKIIITINVGLKHSGVGKPSSSCYHMVSALLEDNYLDHTLFFTAQPSYPSTQDRCGNSAWWQTS